MNIVRLGRSNIITDFTNYYSFVYTAMPGAYELADYWTSTFGTGESNNTAKIIISQFKRDDIFEYSEVSSIGDCLSTEQSFYWDFANQVLYVHFEHDYNPYVNDYIYNFVNGFTDYSNTIYIDDIEYLPIVTNIPNLSQQASIIDYDKQAYITGSITFNNAQLFKGEAAPLDFLLTENIYRNAVELLYLDDEDITTDGKVYSATESDLAELGYFYAESFEWTLSELTLNIQDVRKSEDISIPNTFYNSSDYPDISDNYIGEVIPLAYGAIREMPCTPVDGDAGGGVTFRAAESLTDFGTIQVKIADVWTTKTATSSTLSTGTFTLAAGDSRDADDKIYECKLVNAIGTVVTYASDVIKELNNDYLDIPYNSSFYDTTEWEAEESDLEPIGILLNEQKLLSEWIYQIQGGANIGFRYEITPAGLRTIRIKDNSRGSSAFIPNGIITNLDELPITTDPTKAVFAQVKVKYSPSYVSGKSLNVTNDDYYDSVRYNYKSFRELTVDSFLTNSTDAESRAETDAIDYSEIRPDAEIVIYGDDQLNYKIYDVVTVELTSGFSNYDYSEIDGREYFGIRNALILGISPNGKTKTNTLKLRLLGKITYSYFRNESGDLFRFENDQYFRIQD